MALTIQITSDPSEVDMLKYASEADFLVVAVNPSKPPIVFRQDGPRNYVPLDPAEHYNDEDMHDGIATFTLTGEDTMARISAAHVPGADDFLERGDLALDDAFASYPQTQRTKLLWRAWKLLRQRDVYAVQQPPVQGEVETGARRKIIL